jgi:hypothetical protein
MRNWIMGCCVSLLVLPGVTGAIAAEGADSPTTKSALKAKVNAKHKDRAQAKAKAPMKTAAAYKHPSSLPAPVAASEPPMEQERTAVAEQVHTGRMVCELGNSVNVTADAQNPGHFHVQMQKHTYHMSPVVSATGAIRLEDSQAGAMWLQLSNKSMLMNSKLGQRMADECQSPDQMAVAEAMKLAPPVSLLEGLNTGVGLAKK